MRRKTSNKMTTRILEATVIVFAIFDVLIWYNVLADDASLPAARESAGLEVSAKIPPVAPAPVPRENVGVPVRIMIPSIALDAAVEKVALAADGSMGVPKQPFDTAWYELGPRPGETGSAAIAGHVNWTHGAAAVFADLHEVKSGDKIAVQDDKGTVISFVVSESRRFGPASDATEVFRSSDGKAHLNLITCEGEWDKRAQQYSQRLVVFAERETE